MCGTAPCPPAVRSPWGLGVPTRGRGQAENTVQGIVALVWLSKVGFLFSKPVKHICLLSFSKTVALLFPNKEFFFFP